MIYGEDGTGKEQIARAIYLRGPLSRNPFIVLNCTQMDDKAWQHILSHSASPINSRNVTIYFRHIDRLS